MRLSWNEIRVRAARFAEEWKDAGYEKGETQTFYNEFFEVFGVTRRRVASFEEPVRLLGTKRGFIDLFWKGMLLIEQKSVGRDLVRAKTQALEYFPGLKDTELPRFILLSDFQVFELYDLDEGTEVTFTLADLPRHIEAFGFVIGVQRRTFHDQDPVNIKAAERMGRLHDALLASGYIGHNLERFLVRVLFCLFADDTGIFEPRGIFQDLMTQRTKEDGSDVGQWLHHLFEILDTPVERRQARLDDDLKRFPYVNGELYQERLHVPAFDSVMRAALLEACEFNWDAISPAIFGSLFQSVMKAGERRASGAHYTTEKNILKVTQALFMDELRLEFERLKSRRDTGRKRALEQFQQKLSTLRFLDPACGCGNFLVITYRELRSLEIELLREIHTDRQLRLDISGLSKINVDQFYGIELTEFPGRIAEVALWMMDHIMNNRVSLEFGESYARIPLKTAPQIHVGDALETDWAGVLPPAQCSYVLGNPPFIGAKYQTQVQREQVQNIAHTGGTGGTLDYVSSWFIKAGEYARQGSAAIGFVSTNSITQGEQVAQLWPILFSRCQLEISFAHRTFAWGSDARGVAHVHVVIVGLTHHSRQPPRKKLYSYDNINADPTESEHEALTPYLFGADIIHNRHLVVESASEPLSAVPRLVIGSKPIDGGHYIFDQEEYEEFIRRTPAAAPYMRPYLGSIEFINGGKRWILTLDKISPADLRSMPAVMERVAAVRALRLESKSAPTRVLAETPTQFHVTVIPEEPFLVIPEVSSERREYVPIAWLQPPSVPSNLVRVLLNATPWHFGILTSRMHMAWLRHIGGRLKSDYRYSIGIVYNPFPWPEASPKQVAKIEELSNEVLASRTRHFSSTLADLYDATSMPPDLRKAHRALDAAVDLLYQKKAFTSDRDRVEHLFKLYETKLVPLQAHLTTKTKQKTRNARSSNP